ncbi:MAG: leucine-rich repeat domain-containing protein [Paludibacteraceae bacterium]|nr:leucine-rich repeat domain-containing protein [Paludibacteraceae bacterium]
MRKLLFILAAMLLSSIGLHAGTQITYTASSRLSGYYSSLNEGATTFGPAITKHEFSNGTGTIICNGEITQIGDYAFANCSDLTSIIIPNSVTKIGERAFWGCGLTSVTIPASVKEIGFVAFKNCTQLKDLQFAERTDAIDIGTYVFENVALTAIDIPDWMTEIPEGLFYLNSKLETIYLSAFVRKINQKSFGGCTNLKCIVSLAETPPELAEWAFEGHDKDDKVIVCVPTSEATVAYGSSKWGEYFTKIYSYITYRQTSSNTVEVIDAFPIDGKVEIPAMFASAGTFYKVTGIADGAFYKEDSLVSISLPSGIQYIGNNAFNGCEKLKDINIEYIEDLQTIGDSAFYNCAALGSIVIPEGVQSLGKAAFMRCTKLTHISLPTGLKNIPDECFRLCPLGTEIIVPEGVETIGAYGFQSPYSSTETFITLPSTLKGIKNYAFANRTGLNKVICLADTPPNLGISIFYNQKTAIVYVPDRDAMKIYRDSSSWKNYKFTFADLMAEENKAYLYEVAGNNIEAQDTARHYCLLIDNAQSTAEVQNYTTIALERIDKLTLTDYKNALADSLDRYAQGNAEAQQIAGQYTPRIRDAYSRPAAEQLFTEAYMKIAYIYELIKLKQNYKDQLIKLAGNDRDLQKVATNYGALIDHAETKEQARELYERATMRMNINKQINYDWKGGSVKVNNHTCSTTKGYK